MDCTVVSVLAPNQFWVIKKDVDVSVVKELERLIKDAIKAGSLPLASAADDNKLVAVEVDHKKFQRGSICERKNDLRKVFLVDYGRFIEVSYKKIYSLPDDADAVEPLAFKVQIYGMMPTKEEVHMPDRSLLRKVTNEWSAESLKFIEKVLTKHPNILVTEREKKDNVIYADVLIKSENTNYSFRKVLEKHNAVYNEKAFRKRVIEGGSGCTTVPSTYLSSTSSCLSTSSGMAENSSSSKNFECRSLASSISDQEENVLKIKTWQKKNQELKQLETGESSSTKKSESNSKSPISSQFSIMSCSSQLNESVGSSLNEEKNSSLSSEERARALLKRIKARRSNSSAKSVCSSTSSQDLQLNENSKCTDTLSDILQNTKAESEKSFSCGKSSEIELNINKGDNNVSEHVAELFNNDMPLTAAKSDVPKQSVWEELLKEDRSQKGENSSRFREEVSFRPAGRLDSNFPRKALRQKAFSSRHSNSDRSDRSDRSQSSQSYEKKENTLVDKQNEGSSLKDMPIRQPLKEKNYAKSDIVKISQNRQNQKISETQIKNKYYWSNEEVLRESICKKVPLDRPLVLATDSIYDIQPEEKFNDLKISADIIKNLQKHGKYESLSSIQKYSVNAIRRNLNTVMISGAKTGKTLSYIMTLIDFVQDETNFEQLPDGNGPAVVILCSSTKSAEDVYETCHKLLGNRSDMQRRKSKIQVHLAHGGGLEKEMWVNLTNGCDILVSTPHCLVRLVETSPLITNFERLCYLVIDEADIITHDPFISELLTLLKLADDSTNSRKSLKNYQKVICSKKWTPEVASLVKRTMEKDHVIIFANFLEAAIYARLKPHLSLVFGKENKKDVLFDKVGDKFGKQKILIICEDRNDVIMLKEEMKKRKKCNPLTAHEGLDPEDIFKAEGNWKSEQKPIMICTDSVLHYLKIEDAEVLVHYTLPYKYKTNFGYRFSTMVKNYKNLQSENQEIKNLSVYCLIDELDHYQLPHIVEFSQRLGGKISQAVLDKCEEIKVKREIAKESRPLCIDMLELGQCKNYQSCPRRHAFNKNMDASLPSQPTAGFVSFLVLTVHDACHFSARILEHIDVNDVKTPLQNDYVLIGLKLAKHFKNDENWIPHGMPTIGDICVVKDENNKFHRGQIIEYAKIDEHDQPIEVNVRLMDKGDVVTRKNLDLYEIPKELAKYPPQAVDIILCGLLPMDFDSYWGRPATERIRELLMDRRLKENEKWVGRIVLSLNNILCLDPIELCEQLSLYNVAINKFSIGEKLMKENLAVFNENHLKMLYELCEKGEISVPKYKQKKVEPSTVKPRWAFLQDFFEKVYFRTAFDTANVFIVLEKFRDLVKNLEKECQREAEKILRRKDIAKIDVQLGKVCLAFYKSEETWNRAIIQKVENDWIEVLYVDHGDCSWVKAEDLLPISNELISKLPFQVIECSLLGIDHKIEADSDTESKELLNTILDAIYDFSSDGRDLLYANVITKDLKPETTGGKKYQINLLNCDGKSLSKKLVDGSLVRPLESEKNHLADISPELFLEEEKNEDDDEEEFFDEENENIRNGDDVINEKNKSNELEIIRSKNEIIVNDDEKEEYVDDLDYVITYDKIQEMLEEEEEACGFFQDLVCKSLGHQNVPKIFSVKNNKAITQGENPLNSNSEARSGPKGRKQRQIFEKFAKKNDQFAKIVKISEVPSNLQVQQTQVPKTPIVVMQDGIFSPDVNWIQNHLEVNLRIMLIDVKDYWLKVQCNKILFSCDLNGKFYALELRLFGTVCPKLTEVNLKAFYVEISLKKVCSDFWPRLVLDKIKHPNIHFDNDKVEELKEISFVEKLKMNAENNNNKGIVMKPRKYYNIKKVDYDSSDDECVRDYDDDEDDDDSDPYDCLS